MQTLYLHFYNGQILSVKVKGVTDKFLADIFSTDQVPGLYIIHGEYGTVCVPSNQLIFLEYDPYEESDDFDPSKEPGDSESVHSDNDKDVLPF